MGKKTTKAAPPPEPEVMVLDIGRVEEEPEVDVGIAKATGADVREGNSSHKPTLSRELADTTLIGADTSLDLDATTKTKKQEQDISTSAAHNVLESVGEAEESHSLTENTSEAKHATARPTSLNVNDVTVVEGDDDNDDDLFNPSYAFPKSTTTQDQHASVDTEPETRDDGRPTSTDFDPQARSLAQSPTPAPATVAFGANPPTSSSSTPPASASQQSTFASRKPQLNVNVKPPSPQPWDLIQPSQSEYQQNLTMKSGGLSPMPPTPGGSQRGYSPNASAVGFESMQDAR